MANVLKMADQAAIIGLWRRGWSQRRIAQVTGVDRGTVGRYVGLARAGWQPGDPVPGSPPGPSPGSNPAISTPGSDAQDGPGADSKPANSTAGSGRRSLCEPHREFIEAKLKQGLSAQRIWQDLDGDEFEAGYQSVKRFCRRLKAANPLPFRRMECEPGAEAQVDFGTGAPVIGPDGKRRRTHVLRVVLSHSRKAYSEAVFRQTTDNFIRCIENAFHHFGGVPKTLVIDNLKAAVTKADWYDPEINPKLQSFSQHYGTVVLPTKPRMPRHKGKVERAVDYVQENALKGKRFSSLDEQNRHLLEWETQVADTRIHGTTRQQVRRAFKDAEQAALLPLPLERFPCFTEGRRKVNRDGHVEVNKAYYSVPPEYLGRSVWVRWDSRLVRVFNQRLDQIAVHARHEEGRFRTQNNHVPKEKRSNIERGATYLLNKASLIGPQSGRWAEQVIQQRGIQGVRVLMGLLNLAKRHPSDQIECACETALTHGAYRLRTIRELIKRQGDKQQQFEFIDEHPIIRSLSDYGDLVHTSFNKESWL